MNKKNSKKIIFALIIFLAISGIHSSNTLSLTDCPDLNCKIFFESVIFNVNNDLVIDDDKTPQVVNSSLFKALPGTEIEISWKYDSKLKKEDIQEISYCSIRAGFGKDPSLVINPYIIIGKHTGQNSIKWKIPKESGSFCKIWITAYNKAGIKIGECNTRPFCTNKDLFSPNAFIQEFFSIWSKTAYAKVKFVSPGNIFPVYSWIEVRESSQSWPKYLRVPVDVRVFENIKDLEENGFSYNALMDDLKPNTSYIARVISLNSAGMQCSVEKEFKTTCSLPIIETEETIAFKGNEKNDERSESLAVLTCRIKDFGGDDNIWIKTYVWNYSHPEIIVAQKDWTQYSIQDVLNFQGKIATPVKGLFDTGEVFCYKFIAKNSLNIEIDGGVKYFPPPFSSFIPIIENGEKKDGKDPTTQAILQVKVESIMNPTQIWCEIGEDLTEYYEIPRNPAISWKSQMIVVDKPGIYEIAVNNLKPGRGLESIPLWIREIYPEIKQTKGYVFKAYAKDIKTEMQSSAKKWKKFTTVYPITDPYCKISQIQQDSITNNSAVLKMGIGFSGFDKECEVFFRYWEKGSNKKDNLKETFPHEIINTQKFIWASYDIRDSGQLTYDCPISDLKPSTWYQVQAFIKNSTGKEIPSKSIAEFKTLWGKDIYDRAKIKTVKADQKSDNIFDLQGKLIDWGGAEFADIYIESWILTTRFTGYKSVLYVGTFKKVDFQEKDGNSEPIIKYPEFHYNTNELVYGRRCMFRYFAQTSAGISYGEYISYLTEPLPNEYLRPIIRNPKFRIIKNNKQETLVEISCDIADMGRLSGKKPFPFFEIEWVWTECRSTSIENWPHSWQHSSKDNGEIIVIDQPGKYSYMISKDLIPGKQYYFSAYLKYENMLIWLCQDSFDEVMGPGCPFFILPHKAPEISYVSIDYWSKNGFLGVAHIEYPGSMKHEEYYSYFELDKLNSQTKNWEKIMKTPILKRFGGEIKLAWPFENVEPKTNYRLKAIVLNEGGRNEKIMEFLMPSK